MAGDRDCDPGAEHGPGRAFERAAQSLRGPRRDLGRAVQHKRLAVERDAAQRLQPEPVGPLPDAREQRPLDLLPDVVELCSHDVRNPPREGLVPRLEGMALRCPGAAEYTKGCRHPPAGRAHLAKKAGARYTRDPVMKRTYQPKKRKRARAHGFRARMQTRAAS